MYLKKFFNKYIKNTQEKAMVPDGKILLCYLPNAVMKGIETDFSIKSVYMTSRCVKHLYDKKPAEEFDFIINNLHDIVKYPDEIYKNLSGKRGDFCFVKRIEDARYLCTIGIAMDECGNCKEIQVATAFRLRDENYIKKYTLLWDWGNDKPHRNALDAPKESTNAPQ